ncbi:MAG: hypothetical protein KAK04_12270 [Cyclobacteriaceae bacterium]|nr:hypothetical protein [Cyclobacteriaceae bacterium]
MLLGILMLISGCDKELAEINDNNKALRKLSMQERELINSNNLLSLDILKAEYVQNKNENFFFSPMSVGMALGMVYNGVGDEEKFQIQNVIGLESLVEKEINKSYNELLSFLQVSNDQMQITYANSLWYSNSIDINEDFRTRVMAYYDAEISEVNFTKSSSIDFINKWGNLKTHGIFEQLIESAPSLNTDIFLINAFSLNTTWNNNYAFINKSTFFNTIGEPTEINTLNWDGMNVRISENNNLSFLEIPFEKDMFFFSVVQPEGDSKIDDLLETFSFNELNSIAENAIDFKANVSLPEIKFSSDTPMKSVLTKIGLNAIFLPTTDLSPSFIDGHHQISNINHKAKISLNDISYTLENELSFTDSNLKQININKPFIYFVRDKHTKTVLFAGYFTNP